MNVITPTTNFIDCLILIGDEKGEYPPNLQLKPLWWLNDDKTPHCYGNAKILINYTEDDMTYLKLINHYFIQINSNANSLFMYGEVVYFKDGRYIKDLNEYV